jgi:hypothetical protein
MVMKKLHEGPLGGHFAIQITQKKILVANYVQRCAQLLQIL